MAKAKFDYENLAANLPDTFAQDENSTNYKLLLLDKEFADEARRQLEQINDNMIVDTGGANGLDVIQGGRVNMLRGSWTDETYKFRLKAKQMFNTADGTYLKAVEALAYILNDEPQNIDIREDGNSVRIKQMDVKQIFAAGIDLVELLGMIRRLFHVNLSLAFEMSVALPQAGIYAGGMVAKRRVRRFGAIAAAKLKTYGDVSAQYGDYGELNARTYSETLLYD